MAIFHLKDLCCRHKLNPFKSMHFDLHVILVGPTYELDYVNLFTHTQERACFSEDILKYQHGVWTFETKIKHNYNIKTNFVIERKLIVGNALWPKYSNAIIVEITIPNITLADDPLYAFTIILGFDPENGDTKIVNFISTNGNLWRGDTALFPPPPPPPPPPPIVQSVILCEKCGMVCAAKGGGMGTCLCKKIP